MVSRHGRQTNQVAQRDFRCQHCGTTFSIQGGSEIKLLFALVLGGPAAMVIMTTLPLLILQPRSELMILGIIVCLFGALFLLAAWTLASPGLTKLLRPKVKAAAIPPIRYPRPDYLRRCTCGAWAAVSAVKATSVNGIRPGTDYTYSCDQCGNEFEIPTPGVIVAMALAGLLLTPFLFVFAALVASGTVTWLTGVITAGIGLFGASAVWLALDGSLKRWSRHPEDRTELPGEI